MSTGQASNGYMIRLEVLKMATAMAEQNWHAKREAALKEYDRSRETFINEPGPRNPLPFPTIPDFPSTEEIKNKATELYSFITTK
jgi:hypothetical protein